MPTLTPLPSIIARLHRREPRFRATVLESKGYVSHTEEGKAHRFRARVNRDAAGATATSRVVEKLFGGSTERLLTHLVTERSVTADELRRLRALLDEKLREVDK